MPSKKKGEEESETVAFHTVVERPDGALICDCEDFDQTGKACLHVLVVRIQRDYGPVEKYIGKKQTKLWLPLANFILQNLKPDRIGAKKPKESTMSLNVHSEAPLAESATKRGPTIPLTQSMRSI